MALGAGELVSSLNARSPSLLLSVGQRVIERAPPAAEDWVISVLGQNDKAGLVVTMALVALALGAMVGRAAERSFPVGGLLFAVAGGAGAWATLSRAASTAPGLTLAAAIAAVAAGTVCLHRLLHLRPAEPGDAATADAGRREFFGLLGGVAGVGLVSAGAGRLVARLTAAPPVAADVGLAAPVAALPKAGEGASIDGIPGLSPLFTPNRDFYRIDTALALPRVNLDEWRLRVTGMVASPFQLSYAELSALPQVEADITLSCVSNEVGGPLVGNARWQGVLLADLLARANVGPEATQLVGRSVDGWTAGFPTAAATDGRPAMVALGMNGEPLPLAHGFPCRLVVPGLFGHVSATKWLEAIELTTLEDFDGYWVPRGWSKSAPIKLGSRIDVPRSSLIVAAGNGVVAGVAWGPGTGISAVEVSVDDGAWRPATLGGELGAGSWRQWRYDWDATPGRRRIAVRATDGRGQVQTADVRRPRPDGATGYHRITVTVR